MARSVVVTRLSDSQDEDGPCEAVRLYDAIRQCVQRAGIATKAKTGTGAFNTVLNVYVNLRDVERFVEVFDKMTKEVGSMVVTYNVVIKMCSRAERNDLLGFIMEMIIRKGILLCTTTMHSLVAASVKFGDLAMVEKIVQPVHKERLDLCATMRNSTEGVVRDNGLLEKLLNPNLINPPPLLLEKYVPDTRIYTY